MPLKYVGSFNIEKNLKDTLKIVQDNCENILKKINEEYFNQNLEITINDTKYLQMILLLVEEHGKIDEKFYKKLFDKIDNEQSFKVNSIYIKKGETLDTNNILKHKYSEKDLHIKEVINKGGTIFL